MNVGSVPSMRRTAIAGSTYMHVSLKASAQEITSESVVFGSNLRSLLSEIRQLLLRQIWHLLSVASACAYPGSWTRCRE